MHPSEEDPAVTAPPPADALSRRELIEALLAAAGAGVLGACGRTDRPSRVGAPSSARSLDPIHRLRDLLRQAPDHLIARSEELVAKADLDKLVEFVRDRIALLPASVPGGDPLTAARWGPAATLRGGAGTLRERAELLASLLTAAGAKATVGGIDRPATLDGAAVAATPLPRFVPNNAELAALWTRSTGGQTPWPGRGDDRLDAVADRIAEQILASLPADAPRVQPWPEDLPARIPVVQYEVGGQTRWAIALGRIGTVTAAPAGLVLSLSAIDIPAVEVSVAVAVRPPRGAATDGAALHEVARGRWSATEVAGKHVELTFVPPMAPADLVGRGPSDFPIRHPVLRVVSAAGGDPASALLGDTLALVSRSGGLYQMAPGGLTGPFGPVPVVDPADRTSRAAAVSRLRAEANASTFPSVDVGLVATDATGNRVEGLGASDFVVKEDGKPVPFELIANGAPSGVRLLVMYDASGSVATSWRGPEGRAAFETAFTRALATAAGRTPFVVQVIGLGGRAVPGGWAPPAEGGLKAALAAVTSTSDIWGTLGQALPASGASAAIMISDNQSSLEDPAAIPGLQRAFGAAGIPVLAVPIGRPDEAATALIVARSGGARLSPTAPDVAARIQAFAEAQAARAATTSYRLRVRGSEAGPAERTVEVAMRERPVVNAAARYQVPATADRGVASGVGGVYLTIAVGGRRDTRRLGGVLLDGRGGYQGTIDAAAIAAATAVLDQVTAIAFEPGSPPAAVLLDDAVTAALGGTEAAALVPATIEGTDREALMKALARAGRYPAMLPALLQAGSEAGAPPEGLRVVVFGHGSTTDEVILTTDIPPALNRSLPRGAGGRNGFATALRSSLALSLREAGAMRASAAATLAGRAFEVVAPAAALPERGPWTAEQRAALAPVLFQYADWYRLVPTSGTGAACWVVDPATGTTVAVGESGRGGAASGCTVDIPHHLDIHSAMYWLSIAGAAVSVYCAGISARKTVPQTIACYGAMAAGTAASVYALFTTPGWSERAISYFISAIGNLMGGLPDMIATGAETGTGDPQEAGARVVLAVVALLIGVLGNLTCS